MERFIIYPSFRVNFLFNIRISDIDMVRVQHYLQWTNNIISTPKIENIVFPKVETISAAIFQHTTYFAFIDKNIFQFTGSILTFLKYFLQVCVGLIHHFPFLRPNISNILGRRVIFLMDKLFSHRERILSKL